MTKSAAFAVLTVLLIAGYAAADCVARARVVAVKREAVVVEKVVTPVIAPVAVYAPVPLYGAAYAAPVAPAPAPQAMAPAPSDDLKAILKALEALDGRLKALEGKGATPKPPDKPADPFNPGPKTGAIEAPKPSAFLALAQAKCASCHEARVAAEKGKGVVLLDGAALAPLGDKLRGKLAVQAYASKMPPKSSGVPPLTDEEVAVVMSHLESLK